MQVSKEQVLSAAQANLALLQGAVTSAREENVAAVSSATQALVDHLIQGTPCPVVQVKVVNDRIIEPLQQFIEKAQVLAPDENGAIAISDSEFETFIRNQASFTRQETVKLVIR